MFPLGQRIVSSYDRKIRGPIVGYGVICWPDDTEALTGDGGVMRSVYLVRVARGSSSLGPACAVLSHDHAIPEEDLK